MSMTQNRKPKYRVVLKTVPGLNLRWVVQERFWIFWVRTRSWPHTPTGKQFAIEQMNELQSDIDLKRKYKKETVVIYPDYSSLSNEEGCLSLVEHDDKN